MSIQEFRIQVDRLVNTFGQSAYSTERVTMLWRAVGGLSAEWFKRTCDEFIGGLRHAPLLPDFEDSAVNERERMRIVERAQLREQRDRLASAEAVPCPPDLRAKIHAILPTMPLGDDDNGPGAA